MDSNAGVASKRKLDILNIDTPSVKISKTENQQSKSNQTKRSHKKKKTEKKSPLLKRTQSHDLIKKGFNVCYALDEFIRTSQMYHNEITSQNQSMTK